MTTTLKLATVSAIALGSAMFAAAPASAAPMLDTGVARATDSVKTENVGWVCGPYRCWFRPGYRYGGYGGYGFYGRPYGGYGYGYRRYGY